MTLTLEPEPAPNPNLNPALTPTLTSNPHPHPTQVLVPAGETRYIGLKFAPPPAVLGSAKLHVFVNNEEDKNEVSA